MKNYERIVLTVFLLSSFVQFTFSQDGNHVNDSVVIVKFSKNPHKNDSISSKAESHLQNTAHEEGVPIRNAFSPDFLKRVESNTFGESDFYNLKSKGDIEKLLLGDYNAPVEFFINSSFEAPSSFRIVKGSLNTWTLEVKSISNFKEVNRELFNRYPTIGLTDSFQSAEVRQLIREHNEAAREKQKVESLDLYKADSLLIPVSNQFAERLYEKMVSLIVNFRVKSFSDKLAFDGYSVSFRVVIDYEVWSLWIRNPLDENVQKMVDLCRQIITDIRDNQLDEKKYMTILSEF